MKLKDVYIESGIALAALVAVLLLAGCNSSRRAARAPEVAVRSCEYSVVPFTATVSGLGVSGQVREARDSALWVSVVKLVEVARALATPDSVWISVPLADNYFAGTYAELGKKIGRTVSFAEMQAMLHAPDADEQIARLVSDMGYAATVRLGTRRKVEQLSFPFGKR